MKKREPEKQTRPLVADHFYRKHEAWRYFGYKPTQLDEKIKNGEIVAPVQLSQTGRACGWFGRTIIAHQAKLEAAAKKTT